MYELWEKNLQKGNLLFLNNGDTFLIIILSKVFLINLKSR